jgi:hypothetical protein
MVANLATATLVSFNNEWRRHDHEHETAGNGNPMSRCCLRAATTINITA